MGGRDHSLRKDVERLRDELDRAIFPVNRPALKRRLTTILNAHPDPGEREKRLEAALMRVARPDCLRNYPTGCTCDSCTAQRALATHHVSGGEPNE